MFTKKMIGIAACITMVCVAGAPQAMAHAWVANAPAWSHSYAKATAIGASMVSDSGVVFGQSSASAWATGAMGSFGNASAASRGWWGGTVSTSAGNGGSAGGGNPFGKSIESDPDPTFGSAYLDVEVELIGTDTLSLSGTFDYDANGYLELSVLNATGLTPEYVSGIFMDYGSVECALAAGYLDSTQVLGHWRETDLHSSQSWGETEQHPSQLFSGKIGLPAGIDPKNVVSTEMTHSDSSTPEPATLLLCAGGLTTLVVQRRSKARERRMR